MKISFDEVSLKSTIAYDLYCQIIYIQSWLDTF